MHWKKLQITFLVLVLTGLAYQPQALGGQISYIYDELGRLALVTHNDGDFTTATTFSFDSADNRTAKEITLAMVDIDGDLMPDGWEVLHGLDPSDPSDAADDSPDSDGLGNLEEYERGTDPNLWDTDADGYSDGAEVAAGTDPLSASSFPPEVIPVPAVQPFGILVLGLLLAALGLGLLKKHGPTALLIAFGVLCPSLSHAAYHWDDEWYYDQWSNYEDACLEGEIQARVDLLNAYLPEYAPYYVTHTSELVNPASAYCGFVIYHYEYYYGTYIQDIDFSESVYHERLGVDGKEKGCGSCNQPSTKVGNPCDAFTGNKYSTETDFSVGGMELSFRRSYNSLEASAGVLGLGWRHSFEQDTASVSAEHVRLRLSSGKVLDYAKIDGDWLGDPDVAARLTEDADGWLYTTANDSKTHFDASTGLQDWKETPTGYRLEMEYTGQQLSTVRDSLGNTVEFTYTAAGFLQQVRHVESDRVWQYQQDGQNRLVRVDYPDSTHKLYHYEDASFPHALTGVTDRRGVRYATYAYDANGLAVSTEHAGGAGKRDIDFNALGENFPAVTDSLGRMQYFGGDIKFGAPRVESESYGNDISQYTYNANNQLTQHNRNGRITQYGSYDANNNPRYIIEGAGTPEARRTDYVYDSRFIRRPTSVSEPSVASGQSKVTTRAYDNYGNPTSVSVNGFRPDGTAIQASTTYAYAGPLHQLSQVDGPRASVSDVTLYRYYPNDEAEGFNRARLKEIELANGTLARSNIQYSATGQVLGETRPNGLALAYVYYPGNDRLQSITETSGGVSRTTAFTYLASGEVETVTSGAGTADANTLTFAYDDARRLIRITDQTGDYIQYTLNTEGDRIREEYHHADGTLARYADYEHNTKGQVTKETLPGTGVEEEYAYDGTGNLLSHLNALEQLTEYDYDALNRLVSSTRGATSPVVTAFAYDAQNNPASVTAPNALVTTYANDDLGRRVSETSPDTGTTTYAYDAAGNLTSRTDANGHTATYAYDALNRLISVTFSDTTQNVGYAYDQGVGGTGRLTNVTDGAGNTGYEYNGFGQVLKETRITGGITYETSYAYESATGRLSALTYPSGLVLAIQRDPAGRATTLSADGTPILTGATYLPFGPVRSFTTGSVTETRTFDARYNLTRIQRGGADLQFTRDKLGRVTVLSGVDAPDLTEVSTAYTLATGTNRLGEQSGPAPRQYTHDANGNIVSDGTRTFAYDHRNRLIQVEQGGVTIATYTYDSQNRRVAKSTSAGSTHFHYDLDGRLLGESLSDGTPLRDYIYLDDEPIAVKVYGSQAGTYYFVNDHLGTPRQLVDANGVVYWQAAYLPFGEVQINVAAIENNIRFPGQYFDAETGLHYNWNRYYNPTTGRYTSADPIGLEGGLGLYAYARNDPANITDFHGLWAGVDDIFTGPVDELLVVGGLGIAAALGSQWAADQLDDLRTLMSSDETGGEPGENGGDKGCQCPEDAPDYPEDPSTAPGPDWEWKGPKDKGQWHKKDPKQSLRPHPEGPNNPHGEHYDWKAPDGEGYRIYPDGRIEAK